MRKTKVLALLLIVFIYGLAVQLSAQVVSRNRVAIEKFRPLSATSRNTVFEESIPSLIKLGFLNQKNILFIDGDELQIKRQKSNKEGQMSAQQMYKNNITELQTQVDIIIYGYYSFTSEEIYIIPKLYDIKNDKNYTLQSVRITGYDQNINLKEFENLVASYRDKIRSLSKSYMDLKKVAIILEKRPDQNVSNYEISLYRSYIIDATKIADTIADVEILSWEKPEPHYLDEADYSTTAAGINADIIYGVYFEPVTDYDTRVSVEVYDAGTSKTYNAFTFEFSLLDDVPVEEYLVHDLSGLFSDLRSDNTFDFEQINYSAGTSHEFEGKAFELYEDQKFYLSNLLYRKAFELTTDSYFQAYQTYMFGENFASTGQVERAIRYFQKALEIKDDYHFAWWGIAFAKYQKGDYYAATTAFLKVEDISPEYEMGTLQYNIGLSAYESEQYDLALKYFKKAGEMGYKYPEDVYYYLTLIYENQSDFDGGINYFAEILRLNPDHYYNKVYLAYFNYRAGEESINNAEYGKAEKYLNEAEEIFINQLDKDEYTYSLIEGYYNLKRVAALHLNKYDEALAITQNGIQLGEFYEYTIYIENALELIFATSQNDVERYNEIIFYYKFHAEINPNPTDSLSDVYNSIGYYYSMLGDLDSCVEYFEKALEINPNNLSAQMNMMELYLILKKYNKVNNAADIIINNDGMKSDLEADNGLHSIYYFLLVSANVATNQVYESELSQFERYLVIDDFNTGWDFSLYLEWLAELDEGKKQTLTDLYNKLKARMDSTN